MAFGVASNVFSKESGKPENNLGYCLLIIGFSLLIRLIFMAFSGLFVEEAYYWNYAEHLDFGYFDHPPMVALLIKASVSLFGIHEFSVHLPALISWVVTAFYIFKLTELIKSGAGQYAVMLFSVLPFFFLQSVVITPDPAVMVCWSAALYYLYRALVLEQSRSWYGAGVWLGLGLLSKYTIVLLALPIFIYACIVPTARSWFTRKEPYICAFIALVLFTPVIYWNATHEWASFAFQTVERFNASSAAFSLHKFIGLVLFVLTPCGLVELVQLVRRQDLIASTLDRSTQRFLQLFSLIPLAFFGLYSLNHLVKFDWIGPGLLAILPWFAVLTQNATPIMKQDPRRNWYITALVLLLLYSVLILVLNFGIAENVQKKFLGRYFSWQELTARFYDVAKQVEVETNAPPLFAPLDAYNISSELSFYQALFLAEGKIPKVYPIVGRQIFNCGSLMYKYWFNGENLSNKTLILISTNLDDFDILNVRSEVIEKSPVKMIWSHSQRGNWQIQPFYYKVVQMKPYTQLKF